MTNVDTVSNYSFVQPDLERLALTHRSSARVNNERLEFLGDAVLGQVIADYLYREFPDADEGQLTRIRATLVNKHTLADIARSIDLGKQIVLGEGELKSGGWRRDSILANTLEALIGAIYLDGGLGACTEQISTWFAWVLRDIDPSTNRKDAKTRLQEYLQARGNPLPTYNAEHVTGPAHDQRFTIQCHAGSQAGVVSAVGTSRRIAEQKAAALMLEQLERDIT
ncbi:MAG: ribonuclease-3 [Gammaproteobacteria bacterium]